MLSMQAKLGRRAGPGKLLLIGLAVVGVSAAMFLSLFRPNGHSAAEARARAKRARRDLLLTMDATNQAAALLQNIVAPTSTTARAVQGMGNKLVEAAYGRDLAFEADAALAAHTEHLFAVATSSVALYSDYNRAQEAFATLILARIPDVLIRSRGPAQYELLTRADLAAVAEGTLRTSQVSRVKTYVDPAGAVRAMRDLEAEGIRATTRFTQRSEKEGEGGRLLSIFVLQEDAQRASNVCNAVTKFKGTGF